MKMERLPCLELHGYVDHKWCHHSTLQLQRMGDIVEIALERRAGSKKDEIIRYK